MVDQSTSTLSNGCFWPASYRSNVPLLVFQIFHQKHILDTVHGLHRSFASPVLMDSRHQWSSLCHKDGHFHKRYALDRPDRYTQCWSMNGSKTIPSLHNGLMVSPLDSRFLNTREGQPDMFLCRGLLAMCHLPEKSYCFLAPTHQKGSPPLLGSRQYHC